MTILGSIKKMRMVTKSVFGVTILMILVMAILSLSFIIRQKGQIYTGLEVRGLSLAKSTAYNSKYDVLIGDEETLLKTIAGIEEEEDVVYVIIQDTNGNVLARTNTGIESEALTAKLTKQAIKVDGPEVFTWKPKGKSPVYDIVTPVISTQEATIQAFELDLFEQDETELYTSAKALATGKIGIVRIGMSLVSAEAAVRQSIVTTIFLIIGLFILIFFATMWLTKTLVTPFNKLLENVNTSSTQILAAAEEQAAASAEQSASLVETSTTVEELAATSEEIANNSSTVITIADQTFQGMEAIRTSTNQAGKRILTLGEKSQAIGEIVGVIDDITRQTNLLALNASIEAARAGEAGKGFAVVATEIRKLANNVAGSTNQIKEIIKEIQDATNASILATEEVGKKVEKGVDLSHKTSETAKQIGMATQQQRSASDQTVKTIQEMTTVSKQIASGAEQTTTAIRDLINLAETIRGLIGK